MSVPRLKKRISDIEDNLENLKMKKSAANEDRTRFRQRGQEAEAKAAERSIARLEKREEAFLEEKERIENRIEEIREAVGDDGGRVSYSEDEDENSSDSADEQHSSNNQSSAMDDYEDVPMIYAGQAVSEKFTVEKVNDDNELYEDQIPGRWVYLVARAHGQRVEIRAKTTRHFDPLTQAGAVQLKVGSSGDWKKVRGRQLRRLLGRLDADWFVEDASGQTKLDVDEADQETLHRIADGAVHSSVYADEMETGLRLQVPENVDKDATKVATIRYVTDDAEVEELHLVKERRRQPHRPVLDMLDLTRVGIGEDAQDLSVDERRIAYTNLLDGHMREQRGEVIVADRDDAIYLADESRGKDVLTQLQLFEGEGKYNILDNMHAMRRAGVIVGRTGWFNIPLSVPDFTLPADEDGENELDGTVMVTTQVNRAFQGTLVGWKNGKIYAAKGIIRPPREGEQCGVTPQGALGANIADLDDAKFYVIDRCDESNARLNVQAAAFSTEDRGKGVFTTWKEQIEELGVEAIMGGENLDFYRAGLPAELLVDDRDLTDKAHKVQLRAGYRGKVMGLGLDKSGNPLLEDRQIKIPAKDKREMESHLGRSLEIGETLFVLRDPALSDGSGIQAFEFAGVAEGDVVEVSAFSDTWLKMGGDYDGDAAVVWHPKATPRLEPKDDTEVDTNPDAALVDNHEPLNNPDNITERSFFRRLMKWPTYIGIAASFEQRAWALSAELMEKLRGPDAELLQGCIHSKKKNVDSSELSDLDKSISRQVNDLLDDAEYDLVELMDHKKATGDRKAELWSELVEAAEDITQRLGDGEDMLVSEAAGQWLKHVLAVEEKRQELDEHRPDDDDGSKELPQEVVGVAKDYLENNVLPTKETRSLAAVSQARKKWGQYTHRAIEADKDGRENVADALEEKADYVLDTVRGMIADGRVEPATVFMAEPGAHFALEVLTPAEVREIMNGDSEEAEEVTATDVSL